MSTKATLLLSNDNEHWYHDCSDDSFNIEFELKHLDIESLEKYKEGFLCIKKGTDLHRAIATSIMKGKVCANCGHWYGLAYKEPCSGCKGTTFYHKEDGEAI